MIRRPPRSTRTDHSFPTRRSSDLAYDQWRHYHESLQETEKSTLSTARLLAEYTARTFNAAERSEEHTSELQSLMRISYAVFCLKKKKKSITKNRLQAYTIQRQYKYTLNNNTTMTITTLV